MIIRTFETPALIYCTVILRDSLGDLWDTGPNSTMILKDSLGDLWYTGPNSTGTHWDTRPHSTVISLGDILDSGLNSMRDSLADL